MQSVLRCLHQLPHLGEFERWLCAATILPRVQPMLVAPNIRVPLLCVSPAFQDFAHGRDNPPACAVALQDAQRMCQLNIAHAQHVRFANARQCRGLEHAPQTARHVEVPPIRHGHRHVGDTTGPHLVGSLHILNVQKDIHKPILNAVRQQKLPAVLYAVSVAVEFQMRFCTTRDSASCA